MIAKHLQEWLQFKNLNLTLESVQAFDKLKLSKPRILETAIVNSNRLAIRTVLKFEQCVFPSKVKNISVPPIPIQCDQKKSPHVYKSCPKMISLEKLNIFTKIA